MKEKFYCSQCKKIFMARGEKIEYENYTYGKSWKWLAKCACGEQAEQYQMPKNKKKKKPNQCAGNCSSCPYK